MVRSAAQRRVSNHGPGTQAAPHRPPSSFETPAFAVRTQAPQDEGGAGAGHAAPPRQITAGAHARGLLRPAEPWSKLGRGRRRHKTSPEPPATPTAPGGTPL